MNQKLNQTGFALLMLLVILFGLASVALSGILTTSVKQRNAQHKANDLKILLEAKEALLSYAVDYRIRDLGPGGLPDGFIDFYRMGKLPCPDTVGSTANEGSQDTNCGGASVNTLGYFPFKTVGKGKIEDSAKECLWYIVSGDYKNNIGSDLLNWDTVGYLNLVDEDGNLKHGALENDFPVAFIISPGANLGQDRSPILTLPACRANHIVASYLEGGPNIDYAVDIPANADTLWDILTTSESAFLEDVDYNDKVIAIYRNEVWDRIRQLGDLDIDNTAGVPADSTIEELTLSLAECLAAYGNANSRRLLPYPAPVDINLLNTDQNEYRLNSRYDDDNTIQYGRFPQVVNFAFSPITTPPDLVSDSPSYCETQVGLGFVTAYDERLWENWKDHFFYVVSDDFDPASPTPADATKCTVLNCFTINDPLSPKVAAMVIFAGPVVPGQNRIWSWDPTAGPPSATDNKSSQINYLEGDLANVYTGAPLDYDMTTSTTDYAYCVEYDNALFTLSAVKCADL